MLLKIYVGTLIFAGFSRILGLQRSGNAMYAKSLALDVKSRFCNRVLRFCEDGSPGQHCSDSAVYGFGQ